MLDSLEAEPRLALDTESDNFHRYHERVCLIQLSTPTRDIFIDPLDRGLPDRVARILSSEARTLVVHGADFDVRTLKRSFGLQLGKIFDTSLAARLVGLTAFGLKPLLESELGVEIDKSQRRSDWGKRPLETAQLEYARQDTIHLLELAARLESKLDALGRLPWLEQECELVRAVEPTEKRFDPTEWKKLNGARDLKDPGRRSARAIFVWREETAEKQDVPPFRVMRSEAIVRLARRVDRQGKKFFEKWDPARYISANADPVALEVHVRAGLTGSDPETLDATHPKAKKDRRRLSSTGRARLARLKAVRGPVAETLGLEPGFLISGAVLTRISGANPSNLNDLAAIPGLTPWRAEVLGPRILDALREDDEAH